MVSDSAPLPRHYIIYLTGVGGVSSDFLGRRESVFLDKLAQVLPKSVTIFSVFPYSARSSSLTSGRRLARFWACIHRHRLQRSTRFLGSFIFLRNTLCVLGSTLPAHGQFFSRTVAQSIVTNLEQRNYFDSPSNTLTLVALSGAAQIAVAITPYLSQHYGIDVHIVAIGGIVLRWSGIERVTRFYHIFGNKDYAARLVSLLVTVPWPWEKISTGHQAHRCGTVKSLLIGSMTHLGKQGYFAGSTNLTSGETHLTRTVEVVAALVTPLADNHSDRVRCIAAKMI
jgi:hypothetical protein